MTPHPKSLLRSLFRSLILPATLAMTIGVFIVYSLAKDEYDELMDSGLISKGHLLLNILEASGVTQDFRDKANAGTSGLLPFERATHDPDEQTIFWYLDPSGTVIAKSPLADPAGLPVDMSEGIRTLQGYRVAVLHSRAGQTKGILVVATSMQERNEAILDVVIGVVLGFLLLGLLFASAAYQAVRRSVGDITNLSAKIAQKNEHNLTPIDRNNSFAEIEPAIDTLDRLMFRLDTALTAERAFATNAAHELRTPIAICLAHIQRLKTKLHDPMLAADTIEIEQGLKRLVRLIERLLQMSRAQSGLGVNSAAADINPVISLMLKELLDREPQEGRLVLQGPTGVFASRVDPDALGIILNNLFENALKYATKDTPVSVDASTPGHVVIANDCDPFSPADLEAIKGRFIRKATMSDGFGLGLSIVQQLCNHSGCKLDIFSPQPGEDRGFTASLTLPPDQANAAKGAPSQGSDF